MVQFIDLPTVIHLRWSNMQADLHIELNDDGHQTHMKQLYNLSITIIYQRSWKLKHYDTQAQKKPNWMRESNLWSSEPGNYLYRGKGIVPHVLSSTNCGLSCFQNKTKYCLCTNSHFLSGLTTAQAGDTLPVYRDFPVQNRRWVLRNQPCRLFLG
jgi:hypothetical protein